MTALKFWAVFAVGVVAGACVALMYAPQSGAKTRKQLQRKLEDASDYVKDASSAAIERAGQAIESGRGAISDALSSAGGAVQRVTELV